MPWLPPPEQQATTNINSKKKVRQSNLELYRIIVMLLIVAHHYVVNSGLMDVLIDAEPSASSAAMLVFGAWGKTGINCFLFITGYYMCKSSFSWQKLLKLYLQITFYAIIIYGIFCITGHESFRPLRALSRLTPIHGLDRDFIGCFMMFYLFIPFLNVLINHLEKSQFKILIILLIVIYGILPLNPLFHTIINYMSWFMVIYLIASYTRFYGFLPNISHKMWGWISLILVTAGAISVIGMEWLYKYGLMSDFMPYFFVADSNKLLPILIAISSFMFFKDLRIPHSRLINIIGGATFGVLLIHANSNAMRQWLWKETVDCTGHFGSSMVWTLGYAVISILIIFIVCTGIEWFRVTLIEPRLQSFMEKRVIQCKNYIVSRVDKRRKSDI